MFLLNPLFVGTFLYVLTGASAELSPLAKQLNLSTTWFAPFPPSSSTGSASGNLIENWSIVNNEIGGASGLSFVADPFNSSNPSAVLSVFYQAGAYAPSKSDGKSYGADFVSAPFGQLAYNRALFSYQVGFPAQGSFDWVLGGKLPGLYGGPPGTECAGGNQATGKNCFSVRMMWRQRGEGEAYAYFPIDSDWCKRHSTIVHCNDDYGISISRGVMMFSQGAWNKLDIYVQTNVNSSSNGVLKVWLGGNLVINLDDIRYKTSNMIQIQSFFFSTFFGGSTSNYATPIDTYTYYKDIEFSVGEPVELKQSAGRSEKEILGLSWIMGWNLLIVLCATLLTTVQLG